MTDYAKPATAAEALREVAKSLQNEVGLRNQKRAEEKAAVDALQEQVWRLRSEADRYERFQPSRRTSEE